MSNALIVLLVRWKERVSEERASGTLSLSGKKREEKIGIPGGWALPIAEHNEEPVVLWKGYLTVRRDKPACSRG